VGSRDEIRLASFPDAENSWQVTVDGGREPVWSADSDRLFYVNDGMVMEVVIETSSVPRIGTPRAVVARKPISPRFVSIWASADGERVLIQRAVDAKSARPRLRIVQNWYAEFGPQ